MSEEFHKIRIVMPRIIDGRLNDGKLIQLFIDDVMRGTFSTREEAEEFAKAEIGAARTPVEKEEGEKE